MTLLRVKSRHVLIAIGTYLLLASVCGKASGQRVIDTRNINTRDEIFQEIYDKFAREQAIIQQIQTSMDQLNQRMNGIESSFSSRVLNQGNAGSTYVRWGRSTCDGDAEILYRGYAAGAKHADKGAGSSVLCLHDQPQWSRYIAGVHGSDSTIYGVEYRMWEGTTNVFSYANNGGQQLGLHPAPCVMCYASARLTTVMIPARTECPTGWTKEYQGYIVAGHPTHHRTDYICWDQAPETAAGASDQAQSYIYPVDVLCGILPCSKYPTGMELTCVVCSK